MFFTAFGLGNKMVKKKKKKLKIVHKILEKEWTKSNLWKIKPLKNLKGYGLLKGRLGPIYRD